MAFIARRLSPDEQTIVATEGSPLTSVDQMNQLTVIPEHPWFSVGYSVGDAPVSLPATNRDDYRIGWWSEQVSQNDGTFLVPPTITITFAELALTAVYIDGDETKAAYPTDIRIQAYDIVETLIYNERFSNSSIHLQHRIEPLLETKATKIIITIYAVSTAGTPARILGVAAGVRDIRALMSAPSRRITARMEVTYLKPFEPEFALTPTASETNPNTNLEQLADRITEAENTWFSVPALMDQAYTALPATDKENYDIGWWSATMSDEDGDFSTPLVLSVSFSTRLTLSARVVGDVRVDNYPVDFDVSLYNGITLVETIEVRGNAGYEWSTIFTAGDLTSTKLELTIYKISISESFARIIELETSLRETYYEDKLWRVDQLKELYYYDGDVPIGTVSANEINAVLDNKDDRFNIRNPESPIASELKKNRKVRLWLGVEVFPGSIDWILQGTYYTAQWELNQDAKTASLKARDRLELLRLSEYKASLQINQSLGQAAQDLLEDFGLTSEEYQIDAGLYSIVIPYLWLPKGTYRMGLQYLAIHSLASVYMDRDNIVRISEVPAPAIAEYIYSDEENLFARDYPLANNEQVNQVEVESIEWITEAQQVLDLNDTTLVPASSSVDLDLVYTTGPIFNDPTITLIGATNTTGSFVLQHSWGSTLRLTNSGGSDETITRITLDGITLKNNGVQLAVAKDVVSIADDGLITHRLTGNLFQSRNYAQVVADAVLVRYNLAVYDVTLQDRGHIDLPLGSKVEIVSDFDTGIEDYQLLRQSLYWDGGLTAITEARKL